MIMVLGDFHGKIDQVMAIINEVSPDYILSSGDMQVYVEYPVPHYFVPGNHEQWDLIEAMRKGIFRPKNLHILEKEIIDGYRVVGLGGNYSPKYTYMDKRYLKQERRRHFTTADLENVLGKGKTDILITHEAPTGILYKGKNDVGVDLLDQLYSLKPKLWFVGHHHRYIEKKVAETKVIVLTYAWRGYVLIKEDFNHEFIEIESK